MGITAYLNRLLRSFTLGPPRRPPRRRSEISQPGDRSVIDPTRQLLAYAAAIVLPAATAAALIPIRADHQRITGLILILPVLFTALIGSTGAAIVAAAIAGAGYDLLLTQPYYRLVIDDPDEVVALVMILLVGAAVGILSSRLARSTLRARVREDELRHLVAYIRDSERAVTTDEHVRAAGTHLAAVLGARDWRWHAGYHGGASATLHQSGAVTSRLSDLPADRAELPAEIEVPAGMGSAELGRFILRSTPGHLVSEEERRTASAIATLFAARTAR